jgi:hypothetical protein
MATQRGSSPVAQTLGLALRASERALGAGRLLGGEESARQRAFISSAAARQRARWMNSSL